MEIKDYLGKFNKKARKITKEQELAGQIYNTFNKKLIFPRIMKIIKRKGYQTTYEAFQESKKAPPSIKDPLALFIYKTSH